MLKWILSLFCLIVFSSPILAQSSDTPILYRLAIRDVISSAGGGYISVIDPLTQQEINQISFPTTAFGMDISLDKRRAFLRSASNTSTKGMSVIDLTSGSLVRMLFSGEVVSCANVSPDGTLWALLYNTNEVAVVNSQTLGVVGRVPNLTKPVDIVFSPDGKRAYVSLDNSNIVVIDAQRRSIITTVTNLPPGQEGFFRKMELAISPDGTVLALNSRDTISFIDTTSFRLIDSFIFPNQSFRDIAALLFSPDGKTLYIGEIGGVNLYRYNLTSKQISTIFSSPRFTIQDFKLSLDGRLIFISDFVGRSVIDTNTSSTIFTIQEFKNPETEPTFDDLALAGDFTVGQAPMLQTLSPTAGQQVMPNQSLTIRWNTVVAQRSFAIASHKVELSTDGGMTFTAIPGAEQLKPDVQQFVWQVPDIEIINKAQTRVSTVDLGARRASSSSGNFFITKNPQSGDTIAPMVTFLSPKGGERFSSGDNLQISWMSSDNVTVTSQDLSLSTDGGSTFPVTIANGLPGTAQSFSFPIPITLQTNQAKLRLIVRDAAGNSAQTVTPANFLIESGADTVAPTVTISQPTANQSLIAQQFPV